MTAARPLPIVLEAASLRLESLGEVAVLAEVESAYGRRLGLVTDRSRITATLPPARFRPAVELGQNVVVTGTLGISSTGALRLRATAVEVLGLGRVATERARIERLIASEHLGAAQKAMVVSDLGTVLVLAPQGDGAADLVTILSGAGSTLDVAIVAASVPPAIARALDHPNADLVVITRGGGPGATTVTDTEAVVRAVARCPVPVLLAVGHSRDHPLTERVAWRSVETPTAAADLLLALSASRSRIAIRQGTV